VVKRQKNIYLDALEYGEEKLLKKQQVEKKDLRKHLESKGYKFTTREERQLLNDLGREAFHIYAGDPSNRKYYLNIEGYFKLLAHRELNDARKSSKEARVFALLAMGITILALASSIYYSRKTLEQRAVFDDVQFGTIENIERHLESTDSKK